MPKRKHYKVETLSCREEIDRLLNKGVKYEEIKKVVEEMGEEISIASLSRYNKSFQIAAERVVKLKESMKAYVDATKDKADTDMAEIANSIIMQNIIDRLINSDISNELKDTDIINLSKITATLERNSINRDDLKRKYGKAIKIAFEELKRQITEELKRNPQLLNQINEYVNRAEERVTEEFEKKK